MSSASTKPMASIWVFAAGYFACYVPYTALTKSLSKGIYPGMEQGLAGASLLPVSTMAAIVVMLLFVFLTGWWRHATPWQLGGLSLPRPTASTLVSGLSTAVILTTTTLAYTFDGVSIVFMMLLMRGGVLVIAPVVDAITGRKTRWYSWIGLGLSLAALVVAFAEDGGYEMSLLASVDIAFYLLGYLVRLRLMSRQAKSEDASATKRYFVEEQLVAAPATLVVLAAVALLGDQGLPGHLRYGFVGIWDSGFAPQVVGIGVLSQFVGIFGTLVFLDKSENTFSVPVNRCSSILAGLVASFLLALLLGVDWPSAHQLIGAGLVVSAILVLSLVPLLSKPAAPAGSG